MGVSPNHRFTEGFSITNHPIIAGNPKPQLIGVPAWLRKPPYFSGDLIFAADAGLWKDWCRGAAGRAKKWLGGWKQMVDFIQFWDNVTEFSPENNYVLWFRAIFLVLYQVILPLYPWFSPGNLKTSWFTGCDFRSPPIRTVLESSNAEVLKPRGASGRWTCAWVACREESVLIIRWESQATILWLLWLLLLLWLIWNNME